MPQSLVRNYVHLVFSTKYRQPFIHPPVEDELYAYLGSECRRMECPPIKIGGYTDHVHVLLRLSQKVALMKVLEQIKSHSSAWMKTKGDDLQNFYWQDGYGAFSVNPAEVDRVIAYITNQKDHHNKMSFQDEYRGILKKYKVDYDEKYVWD